MMDTAVKSLQLPWDHFFNEDPQAGVMRPHVQSFRTKEWGNIKRELLSRYNWLVPEENEPHWLSPGRAAYWQPQTLLKRGPRLDSNGNIIVDAQAQPVLETVETVVGWSPTKAMPANNANQIAHYLNKGLRFRPPSSGNLAVEEKVAASYIEAAASESSAKENAQQQEKTTASAYICLRHDKGKMAFPTWRAYVKHCNRYQEEPIEDPPQEVLERMARSVYFCYLHNLGFQNERLATMHIRAELGKPGRSVHPSLQSLEVKAKKEINADNSLEDDPQSSPQ
jgi:hypothetical protein